MGVKTIGKHIDPTLKPSLHESFAIGPLDFTDDPYYTCAAAGTIFHRIGGQNILKIFKQL